MRQALVVCALVAMTSCGGERSFTSTPTSPTRSIVRLDVLLGEPLRVGTSPIQARAVATYSDSSQIDVSNDAAWVTAVAEGAATLSARFLGQTGARELTVGAHLFDVRGTIVEKFGHLPIPEDLVPELKFR